MSDEARLGYAPGRGRWRRALVTAAAFGVLGPMVGGSVFIVGVAAFLSFVMGSGEGWGGMVTTAFSMPWIWIPRSILPAAFVGLLIGLIDQFVGRTSFALAIAIGCLGGIAWSVFNFGAETDIDGVMASFVAVGAAVASGLCWRLTRWTVQK
jgi:hypothetical protein